MSTAVAIQLPRPNLKGRTKAAEYQRFATELVEFAEGIDKQSARGWAYIFENQGIINKDEFDRCEKIINDCRKVGYLSPKFTLDDQARVAINVEQLDYVDVRREAEWMLDDMLEDHLDMYTPFSFWDRLEVYLELVVEKIDLVQLFLPICQRYRIPITNGKGWSDINTRCDIAERCARYSDRRKVILYCGDFDPAGLKIEQCLRKNLDDLKLATGWDAMDDESLSIHRFGLNFEFIEEQGFPWIDNLITARGNDLSDPSHKSFGAYHVAEYVANYGVRKCESNALVTAPEAGRQLLQDTIDMYIPKSAVRNYERRLERPRANLREAFWNLVRERMD